MRYFCCALWILLVGAVVAHGRTWTDATGKHKVEAEFVELVDGKVKLQKENGDEVVLPLDKLSAADQALARRMAKAASGVPSNKPAPAVRSGAGKKPARGETKPVDAAEAGTEAKPTTKKAAAKIAQTPEEAIALLSDAEDKQDFGLLAGIYANPVGEQYARLNTVVQRMQAVQQQLDPILKKQFGNQREQVTGELKPDVKMFVPQRKQYKFGRVTAEQGNRKEVSVSSLFWEEGKSEPTTGGDVLVVEKQGDSWRVWPREMQEGARRELLTSSVTECVAVADACQTWATQIKARKFQSPDEAFAALKSMKEFAKQEALLKTLAPAP